MTISRMAILAGLTRASAMEMDGDALVPIGPTPGGARKFIVYKCQ